MLRTAARLLALCALLAGALALPSAAGAAVGATASQGEAEYRPGEVIVRYAPGVDRRARAATQRATGTGAPEAFAPRTRVLKIRDGETVAETAAELRDRPGVERATPAYVARASYVPDDPGEAGMPGGWQTTQWNFLAGWGVNAPEAWDNLLRVQQPGGRGTVVAVLDTGVAYANRSPFRRSPELGGPRFVQGYDFVDGDARPDDHNGHGTHVASTIAENTGNGQGLTGLAYGARIMPVRVLDKVGEGSSPDITAGIRYAARRGADVINLSFEFGAAVTRGQIPDILEAIRYARRKGALVVAASGNAAAHTLAYPARASGVLSVGATTEHGCQADYSNNGPDLDLTAPGGGPDASIPGDPNCRPLEPQGRDIFQVTFTGSSVRRFGMPPGYQGTSMAAPHVSAIAALVIASRVVGRDPTPHALELRLESTATDLGPPGPDARYGWGLVNAGAATRPG
jgi:serine protease